MKPLPCYVFYDSNCATCHFVVRFILKRRARENFRFLPMEELDRTLKTKPGLPVDTIRVVENGILLERSAAVFMIFSKLGFPWNILVFLRLIPKVVADFFYRLYAKNRYNIGGKAKPDMLCELAPPSARQLLLSELPQDFTLFPSKRNPFLTAQWLRLVFLNYEIDPKLLLPLVPKGTELDFYKGRCYCSMVGFLFANTRVLSWQIPGHTTFEEINLRFYVKRREVVEGVAIEKRGVVFVKEIVPRWAIASIARWLFNENYVAAKMGSQFRPNAMTYSWQNALGSCALEARLEGDPEAIKEDSFEEFITEHYFGYVTQKSGKTLEYEVEHPRWKVWTRAELSLSGPVEATYGQAFGQVIKGRAHSSCVAEGSAVRVFHGLPLDK